MFRRVFGTPPEAVAQAPGRVNLLGEHTDYNDGFVLPTPLPYRTRVEAARAEGVVDAYSASFGERRARPLEAPPQGDWLDYVAGCLHALRTAGHAVPGARLYITSRLPMGAGLASSAALEVAVLRALCALYRLDLDDRALAQLAQRAEATYVGVRCGVMDQMVASLGRKDHALFLDTRTLEVAHVPLPAGVRVAVVDSGVPRRLAEAGYNQRRSECEAAARALGVPALRDLTPADLPRLEALPAPLARRARHVITENARVLEGLEALKRGDAARFGALMLASHASLRDDFEVSTPELDALVALALEAGALGARLTGAGFGGAIVALVPKNRYAAWKQRVLAGWARARVY